MSTGETGAFGNTVSHAFNGQGNLYADDSSSWRNGFLVLGKGPRDLSFRFKLLWWNG